MFWYIVWCSLSLLNVIVTAHSIMTEPQSISPRDCRVGGEAKSGIDNCHGPCDLRAIQGGYANYPSPDKPSAVYSRGQRITVKYTRNNHGPGGFVRLTIVPLGSMMDKAVHERNAFHYSCWGAHPQRAASDELQTDHFGYSYVGNDGEEHPYGQGYYVVNVTIPTVIPDGNYVLGWVWFGGIGNVPVLGNYPQPPQPSPIGYYSDQWSCAYVRIEGGHPLASSFYPGFRNDISQYSPKGCLAANDSPGVCTREPCYTSGSFQKPRRFKAGSYPPPLTPKLYASVSPSPTPSPVSGGLEKSQVVENYDWNAYSACKCIERGENCDASTARTAGSGCLAAVKPFEQPKSCVQKCCSICKFFSFWDTCSTEVMKAENCFRR